MLLTILNDQHSFDFAISLFFCSVFRANTAVVNTIIKQCFSFAYFFNEGKTLMRDIKIFEFSAECLEIDVFIQKKNLYILFE